MASRILHGRREGQTREMNGKLLSVIPEGINPREVTVLQPDVWRRIQNSLSGYNEEKVRLEAKTKERQELHTLSKDTVKHWENTIEGQRLKKLQARELREEKEEEERVKIDKEEAKHQAQKRKEAIERAKTLQYYQTDRVKTFHGALLLTEVLKERDAQIEMKNSKLDADKIREKHLLRLQERQREEAIIEDQKRALRRFNERKAVADFQTLQILDHVEESKQAKQVDAEEGENVKQQVEMYKAAKLAIEEQRRKDKQAIMEEHQRQLSDKDARRQLELKKIEEEDEEIRQFAQAKKKMAKMRKSKETELFKVHHAVCSRCNWSEYSLWYWFFASHLKTGLSSIGANCAREARETLERRALLRLCRKVSYLRQDYLSWVLLRGQQLTVWILRMQFVCNSATSLQRKTNPSYFSLVSLQFHLKQEEKRIKQLNESKKLKDFQKTQIDALADQKQQLRASELDLDKRNGEYLQAEEIQFQEYANKVISEAKEHGRNPYPLIKAAQEGPGGGRGPKFEGKQGLRPSYLVYDGTGVQLPNYSNGTVQGAHTKIYGRPADSMKRLGFTW
ncbi:PREDICTED: coiled-coil domain-containing protein 173-like [Acropora digitifera]|uniref:coiled-coil domain-containing protein 173-like n=1 Tax=Acropora digitifera TaxID=70779 RepID=UPI00077A1020|nr:PREDICTED: coiled-coil domain-containing protein 173-like [Acropora digitifera]